MPWVCLLTCFCFCFFYSHHPRDTFHCLTMEPSSWIPWNSNSQRDSAWQVTTSRALHIQQTETYPQSFWERGLLACPGALVWGTSFWFGTLMGAKRGGLSGNRGLWTQSFSPLLLCSILPVHPREALIPCLRLSNYFEFPNRGTFQNENPYTASHYLQGL